MSVLKVNLDLIKKYNVPGPRYTSYPPATQFSEQAPTERLLGMAKKFSFAAVYQLLPMGILGFGINLATGMMFFVASPEQYIKNVSFHWKMVFVLLAGINALYFMLVDEPWSVGPGEDAPITAKFVAASAIFLWLGVLFFGHMLPFLGNAF